jgi:hypothetical protein
MNNTKLRIPFRVILAFTTCLLLYGIASAQNDQVKGVIDERNGATMTVQSQEGGNVTVVLTCGQKTRRGPSPPEQNRFLFLINVSVSAAFN